jgi:acetylornithine deacetylase/succinyl-diaminopimelate desuccinylase-like protein
MRQLLRTVGAKRCVLGLAVSLLPTGAIAQTNSAVQAARTWRQQHERSIIDEFVTLLSIPNIAADRANIQRNAQAIVQILQKRGVAPKLLTLPGANPVVFGEMKAPGATRTIVFYAHYDGQPLDPKEWATPPFTPTLRDKRLEDDGQVIPPPAAGTPFNPEWRLYARSSADDKAPILAMMTAVDAIRAAGLTMKSTSSLSLRAKRKLARPTSRRSWKRTRTPWRAMCG